MTTSGIVLAGASALAVLLVAILGHEPARSGRRQRRADALEGLGEAGAVRSQSLASPERLVAWIGTRAEPGARVYLEWPSPTSNALPTRDELRQHDIEILVSNFRDDPANRTCPDVTTVCGWVREAGFTIVASGAIDLGRFGEELFARAPGQKSPTRSRQSTSPAAACASAL